jgi:hypothetical protein
MLVKQSALGDRTLKNLEKSLKDYYSFKEGEGLNSVLREVLNNQTLNLYLLSFLPMNKGILLGRTNYFDDIKVHVDYGLTINFNEEPRKTGLFVREGTSGNIKLNLITRHFPSYEHKSPFQGWPSPKEFLEMVNAVFSSKDKDIEDYLVNLEK